MRICLGAKFRIFDTTNTPNDPPMPKDATGRPRSKKEGQEKCLEEAITFLDAQHNLPEAHRLSRFMVAKKFDIGYTTLLNRLSGKHKNAREAHESQQSLSQVQEQVLVEWLHQLANQCEPISRRGIRKKVDCLTGGRVKPSKRWINRFIKRHPSLKLGKPSGLDPKRAQSFNCTTVKNHFELLAKVLNDLGIPWENVWNMDEKGCQRGGGRKRSAEKFFIPRNRRPSYRAKSDNLELVTIIECVNAAGDSIKPGFIFAGTQFEHEWLEEHDDIS